MQIRRLLQTAGALICLLCIASAVRAWIFDETTKFQIKNNAEDALSNL